MPIFKKGHHYFNKNKKSAYIDNIVPVEDRVVSNAMALDFVDKTNEKGREDEKVHSRGMPEEEAWEWDSRTYKLLGDILFKIYSGDQQERWRAQSGYYGLRRMFMMDVFEAFIDKLDTYRRKEGHTPIRVLVEQVAQEQIKKIPYVVADEKPVMPKIEVLTTAVATKKLIPKIECEQMCLF